MHVFLLDIYAQFYSYFSYYGTGFIANYLQFFSVLI